MWVTYCFCYWNISTVSIRSHSILASQAKNHSVLFGKKGKGKVRGRGPFFFFFHFSEEIEKLNNVIKIILLIFIFIIKQWHLKFFCSIRIWVWQFLHFRKSALGFPGGADSKESARNAGDLCSLPGLGSSPGRENGNPLQYYCLENSMDRGAWLATVHGVANYRTRLND